MTPPPAPPLQGEGSKFLVPPFPRREGGLGGLGSSAYFLLRLMSFTVPMATVLTNPVMAKITVAIPPINKELKIAVARMISVGLYPSRIQAEGFSIAGGDGGINREVWIDGWELVEVLRRLFMANLVKNLTV